MSKRWTEEDAKRLLAAGNVTIPELSSTQVSWQDIPHKPAKIIPQPPTGQQFHQALGRLKKGEMNKTEERYAGILDLRKMAGEVVHYWFESIKLRIGDNCFYEPDYLVLLASGELEVHEVKGGHITEDGLVKFKAAQTMYPFRFRLMQWKEGEWTERKS